MPNNNRMDKRWETASGHLIEAANVAGVDPGIMVKISGFESGFNPEARPISSNPAKNKTTQFDGVMAISSAYGYGQFLNGTWHEMIQKFGEKYGIENAAKLTKDQANTAEIRNNPELQAAMLAEFTKENIQKGARLGGPDPDANVYAFHNLGDGDATKFLNAMKTDTNQRVDQILSAKVVAGNPALYGDGSRSLSAAYEVMGQQMDRYEKYAIEAAQNVSNRVDPVQRSPNVAQASAADHSKQSTHADSVLKQGEKGSDIRDVQQLLNTFGYRDANAQPLKADGDFGQKTKEAVQAFQQAHGLKDDGVVGAKTLEALKKAEQSPLLSNPNHPDHALYQQALGGIEKLPANSFHNNQERQNAAATIVFEAKVSGIKQIDHVVLSKNGEGLFAVQGAISDPAHHRIHIDKNQAASQPVEKSSAQLQQETQLAPPQVQQQNETRRMLV